MKSCVLCLCLVHCCLTRASDVASIEPGVSRMETIEKEISVSGRRDELSRFAVTVIAGRVNNRSDWISDYWEYLGLLKQEGPCPENSEKRRYMSIATLFCIARLDPLFDFDDIDVGDFDLTRSEDAEALAIMMWLVWLQRQDRESFVEFLEAQDSEPLVEKVVLTYPQFGACSVVRKVASKFRLNERTLSFLKKVDPPCKFQAAD